MQLLLKPQWTFFPGSPEGTLVDEHVRHPIKESLAPLITRLIGGVDAATLSDTEMQQLEFLNSKGFIAVTNDWIAPAWELSGAHYSTVLEQFQHVTVTVIDRTHNAVGAAVAANLRAAGLTYVNTPAEARLTFVISDSYLDLPDLDSTWIPVICNRMRTWIGPMQYPWKRASVSEIVKSTNGLYVDKVRYRLPSYYDELQRAWITAALLQLVGLTRLKYAHVMTEHNMTLLRTHDHPYGG